MVGVCEHYSTAVSVVGLPSLQLVNPSAGTPRAFGRNVVEDVQ